jgi:hypothetical protein
MHCILYLNAGCWPVGLVIAQHFINKRKNFLKKNHCTRVVRALQLLILACLFFTLEGDNKIYAGLCIMTSGSVPNHLLKIASTILKLNLLQDLI